MIQECESLTDGIIDENCNFQVNAISEDEMKALLKAHLKQDHHDEFVDLNENEFNKINNRVEDLYQTV